MDAGEERDAHHQHEQAVEESDQAAEPLRRTTEALEGKVAEELERAPEHEVGREAGRHRKASD